MTTLDQAIQMVESARAEGKVIVTTNGVFDLLHVGHARYLEAAKALGDFLLVAVNTDATVRAAKGESRPFVPEGERAEMVAALRSVDCVILFNDPTPVEVLRRIRPDIHVKGGDYNPEQMPETPVVRAGGGEVRVLPFHVGHSTTDLAERVRNFKP